MRAASLEELSTYKYVDSTFFFCRLVSYSTLASPSAQHTQKELDLAARAGKK